MASLNREMNIKVTADTTEFIKEMKRARRSVDRVTRRNRADLEISVLCVVSGVNMLMLSAHLFGWI